MHAIDHTKRQIGCHLQTKLHTELEKPKRGNRQMFQIPQIKDYFLELAPKFRQSLEQKAIPLNLFK